MSSILKSVKNWIYGYRGTVVIETQSEMIGLNRFILTVYSVNEIEQHKLEGVLANGFRKYSSGLVSVVFKNKRPVAVWETEMSDKLLEQVKLIIGRFDTQLNGRTIFKIVEDSTGKVIYKS